MSIERRTFRLRGPIEWTLEVERQSGGVRLCFARPGLGVGGLVPAEDARRLARAILAALEEPEEPVEGGGS